MEQRDIENIPAGRLTVDPSIQRHTDVNRVDKMAANFDPDALGVLTVSRRDNGTYHVVDGAHRLAAAKIAKGDDFELPCHVFAGLNIESEARLFRLLNATAKVDVLPLFRIRLVEREATAVAIRDIMEENGWKLGDPSGNTRDGLFAVAAIERLYRRDPEALSKSLATIVRAWGTDQPAGDGRLVEGIGWVFQRYGNAVDVGELVAKLSVAGTPGQMLGRARTLRSVINCSVPGAVAEIVVEIYNKQRRTRALPPWRSS